MLERMWIKRNTPPLLAGFQVDKTIQESILMVHQKFNMEGPTIPLVGIYPEDAPICKKDTCSTIFIAALFIIVRS